MTQGSTGPDEPAQRDDAAPKSEAPLTHAPETVQSLRQAMRRARFDDAERVGVVADLRASQIGRLELLHEALRPLIAQIPAEIELFDFGLMPGATPRLFIDMIGFVEMGRDARLYRLLQDTRYHRLTIAESTEIATMVEAITGYVARRMLEREKALAADGAAREGGFATAADSVAPTRPLDAAAPPNAEAARPRRRRPRALRWSGLAFAFLIDLLGSITFFTIVAAAGWLLWTRFHGQG